MAKFLSIRRPPRWLMVWSLAAVLLGMAGVVALVSGRDRTTVPDPAASTEPPAGMSPGPGLGPHTTAIAVVPAWAPPGVTWTVLGPMMVPVSGEAGPRSRDGARVSGFAHSPVGALVAAAQLSTRCGYSAGRQSWEPTLRHQVVASADRDRLLQLLVEADAAGQPAAGPGELAQIAGFRFYAYTPLAASIGLVHRTPAGMYAITTLRVQWQHGDWMLVAPPGGSWPASTTAIADLSGVVAWGAA